MPPAVYGGINGSENFSVAEDPERILRGAAAVKAVGRLAKKVPFDIWMEIAKVLISPITHVVFPIIYFPIVWPWTCIAYKWPCWIPQYLVNDWNSVKSFFGSENMSTTNKAGRRNKNKNPHHRH
jgi:hypothetical protein